jgi:hypothetical protein
MRPCLSAFLQTIPFRNHISKLLPSRTSCLLLWSVSFDSLTPTKSNQVLDRPSTENGRSVTFREIASRHTQVPKIIDKPLDTFSLYHLVRLMGSLWSTDARHLINEICAARARLRATSLGGVLAMVCVLTNGAIFEKAPVGDVRKLSTKNDRGTPEVIILVDDFR